MARPQFEPLPHLALTPLEGVVQVARNRTWDTCVTERQRDDDAAARRGARDLMRTIGVGRGSRHRTVPSTSRAPGLEKDRPGRAPFERAGSDSRYHPRCQTNPDYPRPNGYSPSSSSVFGSLWCGVTPFGPAWAGVSIEQSGEGCLTPRRAQHYSSRVSQSGPGDRDGGLGPDEESPDSIGQCAG